MRVRMARTNSPPYTLTMPTIRRREAGAAQAGGKRKARGDTLAGSKRPRGSPMAHTTWHPCKLNTAREIEEDATDHAPLQALDDVL
jgi:hypothetical protein